MIELATGTCPLCGEVVRGHTHHLNEDGSPDRLVTLRPCGCRVEDRLHDLKAWERRERAMGRAAREVDRQYGITQNFNHSHVTTYFVEGYQGG